MVVLSPWIDPGVARSFRASTTSTMDVRLLGNGDELEAEDRPVRKGHVQAAGWARSALGTRITVLSVCVGGWKSPRVSVMIAP